MTMETISEETLEAEDTPELEVPAETDPAPEQQSPVTDSSCCEYGIYLAMTPEAQEAYMNGFDTPMDFIAWSQAAQVEHDAHTPQISGVGDSFDIGDYITG